MRAGLLVQKQVIQGPWSTSAWENGPNADSRGSSGLTEPCRRVSTKVDQELVAEQRLKGSCPFLLPSMGNAVRFVTDFIWRSPLGLRINAQDTAGVVADRRLGEDPRRPARAARGLSTTCGSPPSSGRLITGTMFADGCRPSGGDRSFRGRTLRPATARSGRNSHRACCTRRLCP